MGFGEKFDEMYLASSADTRAKVDKLMAGLESKTPAEAFEIGREVCRIMANDISNRDVERN